MQKIAPAAFLPYPQFVLWRLEYREGQPKPAKVPFDPLTGHRADPHDPAVRMPYDVAVTVLQQHPDAGLGFVFTVNDPFVFIDVDAGVVDGQLTPLAQDIYARFPGAAFEWSQSGTGFHLFVSGTIPEPFLKNNRKLHLECYSNLRFVALTGIGMQGAADIDHTPALRSFRDTYMTKIGPDVDDAEWTDGPVPEWSGPSNDNELIALACRAQSIASKLDGRAAFADLWSGNTDILADTYPSDTDVFGRSEADSALFSHLAFWTGKDCARIERLARRSALYRDKWEPENHASYLSRSILNAVTRCQNVYQQRSPVETREPQAVLPASVQTVATTNTIEVRTGYQLMTVEQQLQYFEGCIYVVDRHRIYTPSRQFLSPDAFKAAYGGYDFVMAMDNTKPTDNAFKVFTESKAVNFPYAHSTCFRPDKWPATIIEEEGRLMANTYRPITVERRPGDVTPFLTLVRRLLPHGDDMLILLSYMAACIQYPGTKFQWAPLVQGAEGNGKTFLIKCLIHALGKSYSHTANPSDLGENGSKFTAWLFGKLFIAMEEIYVSDRREVSDALKPLITNDWIEIQGKGKDQVSGDNRANFFLTSNHLDAIRKTKSDRRYGVFYTAQQTVDDVYRDFPEPNYFPKLYEWAREGGYAIITDYLAQFQIPEQYNPATLCHRAPRTTSTDAAVALSIGPVEQEIREAVEEGRQGFCGGWISSIALDRLLAEKGRAKVLPRNKRREALESLGYEQHRGLKEGRASQVIAQDGGRPILYVLKASPAAGIEGGREIGAAYAAAQVSGYGS